MRGHTLLGMAVAMAAGLNINTLFDPPHAPQRRTNKPPKSPVKGGLAARRAKDKAAKQARKKNRTNRSKGR